MGFEEVRSGTVLYFFVPDYFSRSNKITLNVEFFDRQENNGCFLIGGHYFEFSCKLIKNGCHKDFGRDGPI